MSKSPTFVFGPGTITINGKTYACPSMEITMIPAPLGRPVSWEGKIEEAKEDEDD